MALLYEWGNLDAWMLGWLAGCVLGSGVHSQGPSLTCTLRLQIRAVRVADFEAARKVVRPSVPLDTIKELEAFARDYAYSASA